MPNIPRSLLPILLLFLVHTNSTAQGFLHDDMEWHEDFAFLDALISHHARFTLSLSGDTLINGSTYKRIRQFGTSSGSIDLGTLQVGIYWLRAGPHSFRVLKE